MTVLNLDCGHAPGCSLAGLRILLAEDEPLVAATFAELLRSVGCEVMVAEDGWAALRMAAERFVDMLLTDLDMPHLDGFGLIRALRLARPSLPVVIATGQTAVLPLPVGAAAEGPTRLLHKPVPGHDLIAAVAQVSCRGGARGVPRCAFG